MLPEILAGMTGIGRTVPENTVQRLAKWFSGPWQDAFGALTAGILMACAIAPLNQSWLALAAPLLLYLCVRAASPWRALWLGFLYGLAHFSIAVSWVFVSIYQYGNAGVAMSASLTVLFVCGLALILPATQMLYYRLVSPRSKAIVFALVWVLWEWLSTWIFTGFPWLLTGYALIDTPFSGYAPIGGVLLVSLAALLTVQCLWAALLDRRPWALLGVIGLPLFGAAFTQQSWVTPTGEPVKVALVQGNISQSEKWIPENAERILQTHMDLSEPHWSNAIVVWPEAAITILLQRAGKWIDSLAWQARAENSTLITGIISYERTAGIRGHYNMALALGNGRGEYAKRRLVPFGEYVPLEGLVGKLIEIFELPYASIRSGTDKQPGLTAGELRIATAICYEIIYPELMREDVQNTDLLLTISNDSWFGKSHGPLQHMHIARMRALEFGRYLLRDTNNGVTAIVDERGRIRAQLPRFQEGVLVGEAQPFSGRTPYTRWGFLPWLVAILGGIAAYRWVRH